MQKPDFNRKGRKDFLQRSQRGSLRFFAFLLCALCGLIFFVSCGGKKDNPKAQKKIEVTITGLDGNGVAEKKITDDLMGMQGIKTIAFNYLNNQVVVLFDTTVVSQSDIITTIMKSDEGKHKVLDVKTNTEPVKKTPDIKPGPQDDIHDDTENQYKNNG